MTSSLHTPLFLIGLTLALSASPRAEAQEPVSPLDGALDVADTTDHDERDAATATFAVSTSATASAAALIPTAPPVQTEPAATSAADRVVAAPAADAAAEAPIDFDSASRMDLTLVKRPFDSGFVHPLVGDAAADSDEKTPAVPVVATGDDAASVDAAAAGSPVVAAAMTPEDADLERIADDYLETSGALTAAPTPAAKAVKARRQARTSRSSKPSAKAKTGDDTHF